MTSADASPLLDAILIELRALRRDVLSLRADLIDIRSHNGDAATPITQRQTEAAPATDEVGKLPARPADQTFLNVSEVAELFGVAQSTVYGWIANKHSRIPARQVGGLWRFRKDQVLKWADEGGADEGDNSPKRRR